ncbi:MAG TPA: MBL fold metallo-hydrolase [Acidimicrobiales bacterium]|nr:MBL fold metallo-hydrolase [Acidimicrobiales bacterium]
MIEVTGTHQHAAWQAGVIPDVEKVRPGLWSIPVPIPDSPLRYVLVYCLELDDGVALIDAGWNCDEAWDALGAGLAVAGGSIADVQAVLVTHVHPDHHGLAGRVRAASGAWVGLHPADAALIGDHGSELEALLSSRADLVVESGAPDALAFRMPPVPVAITGPGGFAEPDVLLTDGDRPDLPGWDLRTVWTPGHSPGHVCFYSEDRRLLLSGDHVLPRISPHVARHSSRHPDPLGDFLRSLTKVRALPVDEVLPAHEYRFAGLDRRVDQLVEHHAVRLAEIEAVLQERPAATAWDVTGELTWSRPWAEIPAYMQLAANGETLAHLALLEVMGRVAREDGPPPRFELAEVAVRAPAAPWGEP